MPTADGVMTGFLLSSSAGAIPKHVDARCPFPGHLPSQRDPPRRNIRFSGSPSGTFSKSVGTRLINPADWGQEAWLLYADSGVRRTRKIVNTEVSITELPIDLSRSPRDLLATISGLGESVLAEDDWGRPSR